MGVVHPLTVKVNYIDYIVTVIQKNYGIKVSELIPNPFNGYLGETYFLNNEFVLKVPLRGGVLSNPQGNVKFSTYVMNEAHLHGVPVPLNVKNLKGLPYTYDEKLGFFHIMKLIEFKQCKCIGDEKLALLLGFHASQVSVITNNLIKNKMFDVKDVIDPWSMEASLLKLKEIFSISKCSDNNIVRTQFIRIAENLSNKEYVPSCLLKQLVDVQPQHILHTAMSLFNKNRTHTRKMIIHNDINPRNVIFSRSSDNSYNLEASFDYTMACIGNIAKNIANTAVDSFLKTNTSVREFEKNILSIAQGALYGFQLSANEIDSIEYEILAACFRKYVLRWEYWKEEINGSTRNYNIEFLDPKEPFDLFFELINHYSIHPLRDQIHELASRFNPSLVGLERIPTILVSDQYRRTREVNPIQITNEFGRLYYEAYQKIVS